jgi:hypothetical protein
MIVPSRGDGKGLSGDAQRLPNVIAVLWGAPNTCTNG